MAELGTIMKQPREILDFDVDYTTTLAGRTSLLTTATSESAPAGLTLTTTVYPETKRVKTVFSGGTDGLTYKITVLTNTDDGLKYEDEVTVIVQEV